MSANCRICLTTVPATEEYRFYHRACLRGLFGTSHTPVLDVRVSEVEAATRTIGRTVISGVQKKLALSLSAQAGRLALATSTGDFLLKPPTEAFEQMPANEHLAMRLARLCGLEVAECGLMLLEDNQLGYLVRRFDRTPGGERLAMEDFCQLLSLPRAAKYDGSAETCAKVVLEYTSEPVLELRRLFLQLVFSWWIGNEDLHLKNLALLTGPDGRVRLSPAFDLVATQLVIPPGESEGFAMTVQGKRKKLDRQTWLNFARHSGLPEAAAKRVLDELAESLAPALELVRSSYLTPQFQAQLIAVLEHHSAILAGTRHAAALAPTSQPAPATAQPPPKRIFILRDFEVRTIVDDLQRLAKTDADVRAPGLDQLSHHGSVFDDYVRTEIDDADAVIAICDLPNANVGFEIGYALGRGRPVALTSVVGNLPGWIANRPPFQGHFVQTGIRLDSLRRLVDEARTRDDFGVRLASPVSAGTRSLVLCPEGDGSTYREVLKERCPEWELLQGSGWTFQQMPELLAGAGRVYWIVPQVRDPKQSPRDGDESAALGVLAGLARATEGVEVVVLRHELAREVADVKDGERRFADLHAFEKLVDLLREEEKLRTSSTVGELPRDPLHLYRSHLRIHMATRAPFGFAARPGQDCAVRLAVREGFASEDPRRGMDSTQSPFSGRPRIHLHELLAGIPDRQPGQYGPGGEAWVLVGEPGAGKSTSTKALAAQLAEESDGPVPVFLSLPELLENQGSLFQRAAEAASEIEPQLDAAALAKRLAELAEEPGRLWILLDAWDEVLDGRERVQRLIDGWRKQFPKASFLITTRPAGHAGLEHWPQQATLEPLNAEQRQELLGSWLGSETTSRLLDEMTRRPAIQLLVGNPLLLSFVAKVFRETNALPRTRGKLYAAIVDLLVERGSEREPMGLGNNRTATRRLLPPFALALLETRQTAWTFDQLYDALTSILDQPDAKGRPLRTHLAAWSANPEAFLNDLAHLSGLLAPHDGPRRPWRFLHRTLGEYLGAEALVARGAEAAINFFTKEERDSAGDPAYAEPLALMADLMPDEASCLRVLRQLDMRGSDLFTRTLPHVDLPSREALLVLWCESESGDGEVLLELVERWRGEVADTTELARTIWSVLGSAPRWRNERARAQQSALAYALDQIQRLTDTECDNLFRTFGLGTAPNSARPNFRQIPAGVLTMIGNRFPKERPRHRVEVASFQLASTPITESMFSHFRAIANPMGHEHPVSMVTWWEAWLFCRWIGARLPSGSEWLHACRAGTSSRFWSGDGSSDLERVAWYIGNSGGGTRPVAQKPANPWGLHDLHGNVWEWCQDHSEGLYEETPRDGSAWENCQAKHRQARGGAWLSSSDECEASFRLVASPSHRDRAVGFRPARDVLA